MNKSDVVDELARRLDLSKAEAKRLLEAELEAIAHELAIGNRVVIKGLGTFDTREVAAHHGRRPGDGAAIGIPARRQVTFHASDPMRDAVQAREPPA